MQPSGVNSKLASTTCKALALMVASGSRAAEAEVVRRYRSVLIGQICALGHESEAEDLAHEALFVLLQRLRRNDLRDPERMGPYAKGVARKLVLASVKRRAVRATDTDSDLDRHASPDSSPEQQLERDERRARVAAGISDLTRARDRALIRSLYLDEEDRRTVQQRLKLTEQQLSRCLYRAKQRLSATLALEPAA